MVGARALGGCLGLGWMRSLRCGFAEPLICLRARVAGFLGCLCFCLVVVLSSLFLFVVVSSSLFAVLLVVLLICAVPGRESG